MVYTLIYSILKFISPCCEVMFCVHALFVFRAKVSLLCLKLLLWGGGGEGLDAIPESLG